MHANKREELQTAKAGDIVAISGLKYTTTGETLCQDHKPIIYDLMEFPETVISTAIEPKTTADEKKLHASLEQLSLEDPSFSYVSNKETHRKLARITFPIWTYVSLTGVIVYLMLYQLGPRLTDSAPMCIDAKEAEKTL